LIQFVFCFGDGFLEPLQVRSEILRALQRVESLEPRYVLEIGTAKGGTFFLLSRAAAGDALVISLDLPGGKFGGGYPNWKTRVYRRLLRPGQSACFIRGDSHTAASRERVLKALKGNGLDLLFIDGDHTYEGVKTDWQLYANLVRPGGLVIMHDIASHTAESGCLVKEFWAEIKNHFSYEEIIEDPLKGWGGIGILQY
jgi:predicted O-methyltransferase YrrM